MTDQGKDSTEALREAIDRYNAAWNDHDLDAIMAMHAPDMVFENHTAGESAEGEEARAHIGSIFATWLGQRIGWYGPAEAAGFIGAVVGAVLILVIYRAIVGGPV